ncbi:MAG: binding-protein-dependent transport system inner rane component [Thermomicrobiales bacterium]|nr:binding-protein-dependent transport system inner rane component [Thermomicrobiales bacterium]
MEGTAAAWGAARRAASQRRPKSGTRRRLERFLGDALIRVALVVFVLWTLAPVAWMVVSSLLNQVALTSVPPDLSPGAFTLDNYRGVLTTGGSLVPAFRNSLIISFLTTGIALTLGSAAAYAIARLGVPGGDKIALLALATQMFPGIVIIIPLFIVLSRLGLIDTYAGLVVVYLSFVLPIVIWVLKGFFESIPPELEKAAAIDGASTWQTFTRIVLPISLPPLFATGIFAFIESWNEFMFAIILDSGRADGGRGGTGQRAGDPAGDDLPALHPDGVRRRGDQGVTESEVGSRKSGVR